MKLFNPQNPPHHHRIHFKLVFLPAILDNMLLDLLLATVGIILTRTVSALMCHVKSEIYHRQLSEC